MKRVDFENGKTLHNILAIALPMLVAQILNLLYNIVDRIYIARIPEIGTEALGAVGLCFPLVILIAAFTNMFGSGGSPLFSMARGAGRREEAAKIQDTSFFLLLVTAIVLTVFGELFGRPVLSLFGASDEALVYAMPYLRIYLLGNIFSMIATGMNPFINAQGYSAVGMTTVIIGAGTNIILDPILIFGLGMGIEGAAIATVFSQALSAAFVLRFLFGKKVDYRLHLLNRREIRECGPRARRIIGLGMAAFIMQFTNSIVSISCNNVLSRTGGDIYVSAMTMINSARQMFETPLLAISEGSSPIMSYNYGARRMRNVLDAGKIMFAMSLAYCIVIWGIMRLFPMFLLGIFSSDPVLKETALPCFNLYFSTFIFMVFQHGGQSTFKSLGKKKHAIFFSLFRKAVIVVPLTYILPYVFHMGTTGVFAAEPISNVVGGLACFITMLIVVMPELTGKKEPADP